MPITVPYIQRDERPSLHAFRYSRHSANPDCMNLLLDFIESEFGLLPVESDGELITFIPAFVALTDVALRDTSVWVSLYGEEHQFDGNDTAIGKYPSWRRFHVQNRSEDIVRAKRLIQQACDNYRRNQGYPDWDEMVREAEERWLAARNRKSEEDARQARRRRIYAQI